MDIKQSLIEHSPTTIAILLLLVLGLASLLLQAYKVIDLFGNITDIWIWFAAAVIGIAFGLIAKGSTPKEMPKPKTPEKQELRVPYELKTGSTSATISVSERPQTSSTQPVPVYSPEQKNYRKKVRDDLIRIRQELGRPVERTAIEFQSWNAFPKPDPRPKNIGYKRQFDAIESLSTVLNNRNNHLDDTALDDDCIVEYVKLRETGFLNVDPVDLERQRERMRFVYSPLHSAIVSMREGKDDVRRGFTTGTPLHPWKDYSEIRQKIIGVFSNYIDLVDNKRVLDGWIKNEKDLRNNKFWLGDNAYDWFDAIEEEYERINSDLTTKRFLS